ncbi:hypothetical protein SELMODRAFT_427747 [Selaginella moellendorffii]|uniref:Uncharacterized protein n=1 Tax=Selaginella moellendorffii TaxID=88036 RepID=D8T0L2_SELML|nr:hypothetical protein SELMODRAFT_427747 [Selaginella moellendorffii]
MAAGAGFSHTERINSRFVAHRKNEQRQRSACLGIAQNELTPTTKVARNLTSAFLATQKRESLSARALELNTTATQGVLTDSAQKKDGMTATGPDGEIHESTDSDQDFWLPEMTEYANTDDFVAPVPAVQYFLLLLAAKKPERLREIFAYEKNIADKLLTVPESEAVGENKRYLCLFQQVETKEWLYYDGGWRTWKKNSLISPPPNQGSLGKCSNGPKNTTGLQASHRLPEPHKFWTLTNPLGWTSPLEASDWIQMAALLRPDAVQWSKQTLEASYRHATLGNYAYKPAIPFQKTADEVFKQAAFHGRCDGDAFLNTKSWNLSQGDQRTWNQLRPYCRCDCQGCEGGIVWLDSLFWYMLNNLDKYWPDSSLTSSDRLAIFLSLLTANPQVILQIAAFLQIREWMQAAAIEVAKKPANPDLEFIPHGQTKMNICKFIPVQQYRSPTTSRRDGSESNGAFSPTPSSQRTPARSRGLPPNRKRDRPDGQTSTGLTSQETGTPPSISKTSEANASSNKQRLRKRLGARKQR